MAWSQVNFTNIGLSIPRSDGVFRILHNVDVSLRAGEVLGILGESGSGKSLTMRSLATLLERELAKAGQNLLPENFCLIGQVRVEGNDSMLADYVPSMASIFQDAKACLNPSLRVGEILAEIMRVHSATFATLDTFPKTTRLPRRASKQSIAEALEGVRLPSGVDFQRRFPHELSGGMQQRLAIACVLAANTDIIVADEALSALDRETSAGIAELFRSASRRLGKAVIVVSHDLRLIEELCDSVVVMYAGHVLEYNSAEAFFRRPRHPYSRALQASHPRRFAAGQRAGGQLLPEIAGAVSPAGTRFAGCPFADRCERKQAPCESGLPAMQSSESGGFRCLYPED